MNIVGVNLTWLVPGIVGGSEEYSVRLLDGIAEQGCSDLRLRLYGRAEFFDRYRRLADRFETVVIPGRPSKLRRVLLEQTWLAEAAQGDDLLHHMGGTMPVRRQRSQRSVVTIHDLQPIEFPENFGTVKRLWLGRMIPRSIALADLVVCPSRFTTDRIVTLLGTDRSQLRVVPHGYLSVGEEVTPTPSPALEARLAGQRFLLYPAIAYRHKRHRHLLPVLSGLPDSLADVQLVLTGGPGPESDALRAEIARSGLEAKVHVLGRVPAPDLEWLYSQALAMVFPSHYEGFGNPCLEAMGRNCVVIAADAASLPEVVGSAGLLIPPGDIRSWIRAITNVANDKALACDLRERGHHRARWFTVAMASSRLLAVYRELLGSR